MATIIAAEPRRAGDSIRDQPELADHRHGKVQMERIIDERHESEPR
jgi:hypothetical protein